MDVNEDGSISRTEAGNAWTYLAKSDVDGDQILSRDELKGAQKISNKIESD